MNRMIKATLLLSSFLLSANVNAWVHSPSVKIVQIIQWQDNSPIYFKLSNDEKCYVPNAEKNLYSLVLSAYATQKTVSVHCVDEAESHGGISGHRLHRIITF